jgi:hypothetical protein
MKLKALCSAAALCLGAALVSAGPASAATYIWTFTNTSDVVEASGALTTGAADGGGFDVTALSGNVHDAAAGVDGSITSFTPGSGNDGVFAWDNVAYTSTPHVDNLGLLFHVGAAEINIYNNTGPCCSVVYPGVYPLGDVLQSSGGGVDTGTFNLSAVPEPASWAMMLVGFGGMGAAMRNSRRKLAVAA